MTDGTEENSVLELLRDATREDRSPVLAAILTRRSVRTGFRPDLPPADVLDRILAAGLAAPSSKNAQPWRLHIVTCRDTLDRIARLVKEHEEKETYVPVDPRTGTPNPRFESTVLESAKVLEEVPLAVFIENLGEFGGGRRALLDVAPGVFRRAIVGYQFELIGLGGAIQNMWLTAVDLGIEGVFMGDVLVAENEIRTLLGVEGDLVGVLALGYSEAAPTAPPLEDPARRIVRHP